MARINRHKGAKGTEIDGHIAEGRNVAKKNRSVKLPI